MNTTIKPVTDNPTIVAGLKAMPAKKKTSERMCERFKVWAVDFDGTICKNAWPNIGEPNKELIDVLKYSRLSGVKLILWTSREGEDLQAAVEFCRRYDLEFDAVNSNLPEIVAKYEADPRKIGADLYIDDKAFPWWGSGEQGDLCKLIKRALSMS